MEKKILEIIKENLSEKEVGIIRESFEELELLREKDESNKGIISSLRKTIEDKEKAIGNLQKEKRDLEENANSVKIQEDANKQESEKLYKEKCELEKDKAVNSLEIMRECMQLVFKPSNVRRSYQDSIVHQNYDYSTGRAIGSVTETINKEENIEE